MSFDSFYTVKAQLLEGKNYRFFMLFQNPLLIIRQLQPSVDFAVRDQQEIIFKYRKHEVLTESPEQDILAIWHFHDTNITPNKYQKNHENIYIIQQKLLILQVGKVLRGNKAETRQR